MDYDKSKDKIINIISQYKFLLRLNLNKEGQLTG
jgi:hypothetical protein